MVSWFLVPFYRFFRFIPPVSRAVFPVLFLFLLPGDSRAYVPSYKCGKCHKEIYQEWKKSRHSIAWTNAAFLAKSKNRTDKSCYMGCHAPQRVINQESLKIVAKPRQSHRKEGVSCFSCHVDALDNKAHHGPLKNATSPFHDTVYDPKFKSSNACIPCHQYLDVYDQFTSLKESGLKDKTCQSCHMPKIKRKSAKQGPFRSSASHLFVGSRDTDLLKKSVALSGKIAGDEAQIAVENIGGGHQLPGGIWRSLFLRVIEYDKQGKYLDEILTEYSIQKKRTLLYKKPDESQKKLKGKKGTIEARLLLRLNPDDKPEKFKKIKRIFLKFDN